MLRYEIIEHDVAWVGVGDVLSGSLRIPQKRKLVIPDLFGGRGICLFDNLYDSEESRLTPLSIWRRQKS